MQIEIALETYDDIFSDFDIRTYRERQISIDFLEELKIRTAKYEKGTKLIIELLLPGTDRRTRLEKIISKRIIRFFSDRYNYNCAKNRKLLISSAVQGFLGLLILFIANLISGFLPELFGDFLLIPSWFLVWAAFEKLTIERKRILGKEKYYKVLMSSSIVFKDRR